MHCAPSAAASALSVLAAATEGGARDEIRKGGGVRLLLGLVLQPEQEQGQGAVGGQLCPGSGGQSPSRLVALRQPCSLWQAWKPLQHPSVCRAL
jgi:hypothetical protein